MKYNYIGKTENNNLYGASANEVFEAMLRDGVITGMIVNPEEEIRTEGKPHQEWDPGKSALSSMDGVDPQIAYDYSWSDEDAAPSKPRWKVW